MHCARKRIVILLYLLPQNVRCTFLKVEIAANILNFALGREYNFIATFAFSPLYILYQNPRIKFKPPPISFPIEVTCNAIIPLLQFSRRYQIETVDSVAQIYMDDKSSFMARINVVSRLNKIPKCKNKNRYCYV